MRAAGSTGSGRYLTGDFIGADVIRNEITAQATAAIHYVPDVDTVFEIGGQDSKYIRIDGGVVTDFEMNKVCAAGTGSFLEEQAEKLGIAIVDEFGRLALSARAPVRLGDRCTVFMESDLNARQQQGRRRRTWSRVWPIPSCRTTPEGRRLEADRARGSCSREGWPTTPRCRAPSRR